MYRRKLSRTIPRAVVVMAEAKVSGEVEAAATAAVVEVEEKGAVGAQRGAH